MLREIIEAPQSEGIRAGALLLAALVLIWILFFNQILKRREGKKETQRRTRIKSVAGNLPWKELYTTAERTVFATIQALPPELNDEAMNIPWVLKDQPGGGRNILGCFVASLSGEKTAGPGVIFIYLGNIYQYCEEQGLGFEEEVRITYLHELGHYLGLGEEEIRLRGLS